MAGFDVVGYSASRKYTEETVEGAGAIKGKNCIVESIEKIEGYTRVHFKWTLDDGTVQRQYTDLPDGQKGDPGDKGDTGVGLPEGGTVGQVLVKKSSADYDMEWGTPGGGGDMLKSVYDTDNDGKVNSAENADTVGGHTVAKDVPTDAKFTDTVYDDTEIREEIADKVDKVSGKGLSTEDYTSEEKTKLAGVEASAEVNTIESITLNGTEVTPDANKNVALTVITNTVNNLVNYYLKSETYTKTEVDDIVTAIKNSRFEVVATLPTTDIKTNVIYLVPKSPSQTSNVKDEYINLDGTTAGWEKIGDTEVDLSGYVTTQALNIALANYTTTADLTTLLAGKQDTLTFDNVPTENSDNPVKSDGVYSANQNIYEVMGQMGAKNLITYPHSGKTETKAGITFTENADGSVTVNGTATELVRHLISSQQFEVGKKYILSGCPSGGSHSLNGTYTLYTQAVQNYDDGEGVEFTWDASITGITIAVWEGVTVDNLTFYPMIRLASDTDSTYQPYVKTNKELTDDAEALAAKVNSLKEHTGTYLAEVGTKEGSALAKIIYGMSVQDGTPTPDSPVEIKSAKADFKCVGKNLIPYPPYNDGNSKTQNGITFTANSDGTVTVNGTATAPASYNCIIRLPSGIHKKFPNGRYHASGCPSGGTGIRMFFNHTVNGAVSDYLEDRGNGGTFTVNGDDFYDDGALIGVQIYISSGYTANNLVFKPMITLADAEDSDYEHFEPYQHTDVTTDLTLRAIEVASTYGYTYERDGKYYIADTIDWSEDEGFVVTRRVEHFHLETVNYFQDRGNNLKQINVALPKKSKFLGKGYSNRFKVNASITRSSGDFYIDNTGSTTHLWVGFVESTDITNTTTGTTWLSNNETYVDYVLADSAVYTEHITAEQAQALLSLKTYDEATSISATGDIEPSVDLEYAKSEMGAKALTGHNKAYIAQELEGVYGVKNLIPYPYYDTSETINGLTFTDNGDGSVTINGTCTDQTFYQFWGGRNNLITTYFLTENENYIMTLDVDGDINLSSGDCVLSFRTYPQNSTTPYQDVFYITKVTDNIRKQFTFTQPDGYIYSLLWLEFRTGAVLNNVTIKPMLRLASIQSNEYQPYAMSNHELTKKIKELETALIKLSSQ